MTTPFSLSLAGTFDGAAIMTEDRALRLYRSATATLIAALCAMQSVQPAPAPATAEPEVATHALSGIVAAWLGQLHVAAQWQLATVCALALAVGLWPRLSGALLVVILGASHAQDTVAIDLSLAAFFALWLLVLPTGVSDRSRLGGSSGHLAAQIFQAHVALLYVNPALFVQFDAEWRPWSALGVLAAALPGLMLLDRGGWPRIATIGIQIVLHAVLARSGHVIAHALIASTTLLSLSHLRRPPEHSATKPGPNATFDGHAACAVALACIGLVMVGAQLLHASEQLAIGAELFRDLGRIAAVYSLR